jgi:Na+:H+ antiporter, NhaA family
MTPIRRAAAAPTAQRSSPLGDFLHAEAAGGVLLAIGAAAALVWANSPWSASYHDVWETSRSLSFHDHVLAFDLREIINEGLMTIFFFVVGLEIRRELAHGHLSSRRSALLPVAAAFGGMAAPALLYLAIAGGESSRGWAVPVATDIALAVGVLSVAGSRVPPSLRAHLLGLAIVDDIGAIIIIAVLYSSGVRPGWLAGAAGGLGLTVIARRFGVQHVGAYIAFGTITWLSLHEAGIHPTLAGVAMGLLAPTEPLARGSRSVVEWLEHALHPWTSYAIVPAFALANSGIVITDDGLRSAATSAVVWGIVVGLVVGKPLGVLLASRLAVRTGLADPPIGTTARQTIGVGACAGIGFTVALFIAELAFDDPAMRAEAKLAVLIASLVAASAATVLLRWGSAGAKLGTARS